MDGCFITTVKTISITFGGGRRGTRTPSPFKERIYSPRGYQLPVTLPKSRNLQCFYELLNICVAPYIGNSLDNQFDKLNVYRLN